MCQCSAREQKPHTRCAFSALSSLFLFRLWLLIARSHFPFPPTVHSSRPPAPALGPISAFFPHLASLSPAWDPSDGTCHCWPDVTVIYTSDFSVEQPAGSREQASSRLPHGTRPGGCGPSVPPSERRGRRITSRWLHVFPCAPVMKRRHHEGRNGVFLIIIISTAAPQRVQSKRF